MFNWRNLFKQDKIISITYPECWLWEENVVAFGSKIFYESGKIEYKAFPKQSPRYPAACGWDDAIAFYNKTLAKLNENIK